MSFKLKNLLLIAILQLSYALAFGGIIITDVHTIRIVTDYNQCHDTTYTASMAALTQDCNSCTKKFYKLQFTSLNANYPASISLDGICNADNSLDWKTSRASSSDPIYRMKNLPININDPNWVANNSLEHYGIFSSDSTLVAVINIIPGEFGELYITDFYGNNITIKETTCQGISCQTTTLQARVALDQGQLVNGKWLMNDDLRASGKVPLFDPYQSKDTTTASVLSVTGANAIVDWIFLELREGTSGSTNIVASRAALLQRDGDIVDVDGYSRVKFNKVTVGSYYITVRHRNHLGFRSEQPYFLRGGLDNNAIPKYNFTNNSIELHGTYPNREISTGIYAMNGGDANSDGAPDAFDDIIYSACIASGIYNIAADYNMDGVVNTLDLALWNITNGMFEELD